jgi:hypothetical protein
VTCNTDCCKGEYKLRIRTNEELLREAWQHPRDSRLATQAANAVKAVEAARVAAQLAKEASEPLYDFAAAETAKLAAATAVKKRLVAANEAAAAMSDGVDDDSVNTMMSTR